METLNAVIDYLPESMRDIVRVVGIDAAITIVQERGGICMYIPATASPDHWLANAIGMEAFTKLVEYAPGWEPKIPLCKEALIAIKEREILKKAQSGKSQAELAREYKMTERGIRKLLRRAETAHTDLLQQHPLF